MGQLMRRLKCHQKAVHLIRRYSCSPYFSIFVNVQFIGTDFKLPPFCAIAKFKTV
jgi:hypothetical protein